jgi:hypothetical protein
MLQLARNRINIFHTLVPTDADGSEYKGKWEDPKPQASVHYYYICVRQKDGQLAWASPMWIEYAK